MFLGDLAPQFSLPGVDGRTWRLDDFAAAKVLVVVQMCNHCPYVIGYLGRTIDLAKRSADREVAFVGINSNDAEKYPTDSFAAMRGRATDLGLPFPYLHDEHQTVARAYGAERTPEYRVFDAARHLVYQGRLDDNLEDPAAVRRTYLADAIEAALAGQTPAAAETQAVGCTVKWR